LPAGRILGDAQIDLATGRCHCDTPTKGRLPWGDGQVEIQVLTIRAIHWMRGKADLKKKIPRSALPDECADPRTRPRGHSP
jgi:hypothetical protein